MSIRDKDNNELISFNAFWSFMAKVALAAFVPMTLLFVSLMTWTVSQIFDHSTRLALLERDALRSQRGGVSQSVNVGQAAKMAQSGKTYLTVADVAEREGVATRTITEWISDNRVMPLPEKGSKGFEIALDYRILPQSAACCGDEVPAATAQVRAKTQDLQTQDARPETPTPQ